MRIGSTLGLLAVPLLAGVAAWTHGRTAQHAPPRSCPHYWSAVLQEFAESAGRSVVPLSGGVIDIPEYNDCQRLIASSGHADRAYGPLAAIFAGQRLSTLPARLGAAEGRGLAVATIYSADAFAPLGIQSLFNCLYFVRRGNAVTAWMVPLGRRDELCNDAPIDEPAPPTATSLAVDVLRSPEGTNSLSVARWEWSDESEHQYIGVRCGRDWCRVRPRTVVPTDPIAVDASVESFASALPWVATFSMSAFRDISALPGSFDRQFLAPAGGGAQPTGIMATAYPAPGLADLVESDYFGQWQLVAMIWIPPSAAGPALTAYQRKFGYREGWNAVSLCRGDNPDDATDAPDSRRCRDWPASHRCGPPQPAPASIAAMASASNPTEVRWFARVDAQAGGTDFSCTTGRPHYALRVAPAVRWRWVANDETVWTACGMGCCEVENP